jgi:hypothetical protein
VLKGQELSGTARVAWPAGAEPVVSDDEEGRPPADEAIDVDEDPFGRKKKKKVNTGNVEVGAAAAAGERGMRQGLRPLPAPAVVCLLMCWRAGRLPLLPAAVVVCGPAARGQGDAGQDGGGLRGGL